MVGGRDRKGESVSLAATPPVCPKTPALVHSCKISGTVILMMGGVDVAIWGNGSEVLIYPMQPLKDKYVGGVLRFSCILSDLEFSLGFPPTVAKLDPLED